MYLSAASDREALAAAGGSLLPAMPLDFSAALSAAWDDTRARLLSNSSHLAEVDAYDRYIDDIHRRTGQRLRNPLTDLAIGQTSDTVVPEEERFTRFDTAVAQLAVKHSNMVVKSRGDLGVEIAGRAQGLKAEADKPTIGWGGTGAFLGQTGALLTDPINLVSMVLLNPSAVLGARATLAGRLAQTAAAEGVVNMASEAAIQPIVKGYNERLGIPYSWGDAVENIAAAGVGGAVLGAAGQAAGEGARALLGRWRAGKAAGRPGTLDTEAAEAVLEAAAARQASSPFPPGIAGDSAHARAMDRATGDVAASRPVRAIDEEIDTLRQVLDGTRNAPLAHPYAMVARMEPADIEAVLLAKGPAVLKEDGAIIVEGKELQEAFGNRGRGVVKILWRHGEMSPKAGTPSMVTADDILRTPLVVRAFDPARSGKGQHANLKWIVERADGRRLAYVAEKARQGGDEWEIVTVHVIERKLEKDNPLSPRQQGVQFDPDHEALVSGQANGPSSRDPSAPQQSSGPLDASVPPAVAKPKAVARPLPPELAEPPKVETLAGWLRRQGGVKDEGGWMASQDVIKRRPGLINNRAGMPLDDAAHAAWEQGFFPEFTGRPTEDELRTALLDELGHGAHRVRETDMGAFDAHLEWEARMAEFDRAGVDPRGKTIDQATAELHAALDQDANIGGVVDDFLSDPPLRARDDALPSPARPMVEPPEVLRANAVLLEDDVMVPVGAADDVAAQQFHSARQLAEQLDHELDAWAAAAFCFGKV